MPLPTTLGERQRQSYEECNSLPAKRVKVCQEPGEVLKVDLIEDGESGVATNTFNQISNVPSGTPTTVVSYTVPVGKTLYLKKAEASGNNRAKFTVKIAGSAEAIKRTWHSDFNVEFDWSNLAVSAGVTILIEVEHNRSATNEFDGRILGSLA